MSKKKIFGLIFIFLIMIFIKFDVLAVSEDYEVIKANGWGEKTDVLLENSINGKKSKEYIIQYPGGSNYIISSNTNQFCVYPIFSSTGYYYYFPITNSCQTSIMVSGLTKWANSSAFELNITVKSSLPTLKKCSDEQKKSLGFSDNSKSECYYCSSHQCLGSMDVTTDIKEIGIIYKEANNALKIAFDGGIFYQKKNKFTSVKDGFVDSIKSVKDKSAIIIKLNGQVGKKSYLTRYNDDSKAGAGVINVGQNTAATPTTLSKSCPTEDVDSIKAIDGVGSNVECYYCNTSQECLGDIKVGTNVDTVAIMFRHATNTLKISLDGSPYYQKKNAWETIDYHSIERIYGAKSNQAILLDLTGKDGSLDYSVKYNNNNNAASGKIIIGSGINPEDSQKPPENNDGDNDGNGGSNATKVPSLEGNFVGNYTCGNSSGQQEVIRFHKSLPDFTSNLYDFLKILTPVIIIITGMLDIVKAVTAQKEDELKKAQKKLLNRILIGMVVFLVYVIVEFVIAFVAETDTNDAMDCVNCFLKGSGSCSTITPKY